MGTAHTSGSFFRADGLKNALLRLMPRTRSDICDTGSRPNRRERPEKRRALRYSVEK